MLLDIDRHLREREMLRELPPRPPSRGEAQRRWFFCHEMDLVVWFDTAQAPVGFELAYDKSRHERSISWRVGRGFRYYEVDDGEDDPGRNRSPLLAPAKSYPRARLVRDFESVAGQLPEEVAAFVLTRLKNFEPNQRTSARHDG